MSFRRPNPPGPGSKAKPVTSPAEYVRTVRRQEPLEALVEETKARAWVSNAEHAVIQLGTRERVMVRGGPDGIDFLLNADETGVSVIIGEGAVRVRRIFFHTHPRVTGPSDGDLRVLEILGQTRAYIFEIGGDSGGTLIRPKREGKR